MNLTDTCEKPTLEGYLHVYKVNDDGTEQEIFVEQNLVVNQASWILRDLMFGSNEDRISQIYFGDMNLVPTDDLKNINPPALSDTDLANHLYSKETTKTIETYADHPAIRYETTLNKNEFNGDGEQLITEYALATIGNRIFTRKTRAAIYKDNESTLKFVWWLVFN